VSVTVNVQPLPGISLSANPQIVRTGATSQLAWTVTDATACEASAGWSGSRPTSGSETVGPFTQDTTFTLTCTGPGGMHARGTIVRFRPGVNTPPTANAGPDQTVISTSTVQLAEFNSSDDRGIVAFAWTQTSGPAVTLSDSTSRAPTFVAPTVAADTVLTFSLRVTDDEGATSAPDTVDVTVQPIPPTVTIRGLINHERVPLGLLGRGLSYGDVGYVTLNAEVLVEVLDAGTQSVLASGRFSGDYELSVPSVRNVALRATAEMSRQAPQPLPHWQISVRDLDDDGAPLGPIHAYTGPTFNTGPGGTRNLEIPSGWNQVGQLVGPRHAAPFAVLHTIRAVLSTVLSVEPNADFPPLTIDWGPNNTGGRTFYTRDTAGTRIVLSAEPNVDTDEYDPHVIAHELGHYMDDAFLRLDNIGGQHAFGDRLDMRVAFGEGFASAFAGIALGGPVMRDTFGQNQADEGVFSIESDFTTNEGWYSEASCQEILWDLFDGVSDGADTISLGFQPLWNVLQGSHRQTDAMASIFSFITPFKQQLPLHVPAAAVDALLAAEQIIGTTVDIHGSTETNDAASSDVLPIYTNIALGGSVQVRSISLFGTQNKLSNHRFLRLNLPSLTSVRIQVTAGAGRDPDVVVFRRGVPVGVSQGSSNESFVIDLEAGEYVLDVFDCGNAGCNPGVAPLPTDIAVTVTPT